MDTPSLTIGQVAKQTDVGVDTIRFYERSGLLGYIERNGAGYRIYKPSIIKRLEFIKQSRSLGFSLNEIGKLLDLMHRNKRALSSELKGHLHKRQEAIRTQISELVSNLELLEGFLCNACDDPSPNCDECQLINGIIGTN
ncbi:MAG: MerR family transcriptional regulator [Gammaproteobacteria bacterium]|nr:MerR family transcriptional regulator [Gammaproteobacteria bacterium]